MARTTQTRGSSRRRRVVPEGRSGSATTRSTALRTRPAIKNSLIRAWSRQLQDVNDLPLTARILRDLIVSNMSFTNSKGITRDQYLKALLSDPANTYDITWKEYTDTVKLLADNRSVSGTQMTKSLLVQCRDDGKTVHRLNQLLGGAKRTLERHLEMAYADNELDYEFVIERVSVGANEFGYIIPGTVGDTQDVISTYDNRIAALKDRRTRVKTVQDALT